MLNICVPNNRASNRVQQQQIGLNREIDKPAIMVGDVSTPLSVLIEQVGRKSVGIEKT